MSSLKTKPGSRIIALLIVGILLISMIPITAIVSAVTEPDPAFDYLAITDLKAEYKPDSKSVALTWTPIEGEVTAMSVTAGEASPISLAVDAFSYSYDASAVAAGTELQFTVTAGKDTQERSATVKITVPYIFESIAPADAVNVENDLTLAEIKDRVPTDIKIIASGKEFDTTVAWSTEGTTYDKTSAADGNFTLNGTVSLPANVINPEAKSLATGVQINVAAAVSVSWSTNLSDGTLAKKVGEDLELEVKAAGTAPTYQWYKGDTAIDGATNATYSIAPLAIEDAGTYFCKVTGKDGSTATSRKKQVTVSKIRPKIGLQIDRDPSDPTKITLTAIGIPTGATGTVAIYDLGDPDNALLSVTLPASDLSVDFTAENLSESYNFKVVYDAPETDEKYVDSTEEYIDYGFDKGSQTAGFAVAPGSEYTYTEDLAFTVTGSGSMLQTPVYEYAIVNEDPANEVATIKNNGEVTIKSVGVFRIKVKLPGDENYNGASIVSDEIRVVKGTRNSISFENSSDVKTYSPDFSYTQAVKEAAETSEPGDKITYALDNNTTAEGISINSETGEIKFANSADYDKNNPSHPDYVGKAGNIVVTATKTSKNYKPETVSYTLTVNMAEQAAFAFDETNPKVLTYTANNGTTATYTTTGGTVRSAVQFSITEGIALEPNEQGDPESVNVAEIDVETGKLTALRSGKVTIVATLPGNGVYNDATTEDYTVTINRGTVKGFGFKEANPDMLTTKYGVAFTNKASGGQTDARSDNEVDYSITSSVQITDYTKIDPRDGTVYFDGDYALADYVDGGYLVTVTATKAQNDKYEECSISYTLTVTRDAVDYTKDFLVNGEIIKSSDCWYNSATFEITAKGDYTAVGLKKQVEGKTIIEWGSITPPTDEGNPIDGIYTYHFYLKTANGAVSQLTTQTINFDKTEAEAELKVGDIKTDWDKFVEAITFGLYKKESKDVTITATDNLSGIASIQYCEQNKDFINVEGSTTVETIVNSLKWSEPLPLTVVEDSDDETNEPNEKNPTVKATTNIKLDELTNKKVVIYAKVTDHAGNVSYFRSEGMIFDNITPDASLTTPEPIINITVKDKNSAGLYNGDIDFALEVIDRQTEDIASGIKNITVTVEGTEADGLTKEIVVESKKEQISRFDSGNVNPDEFEVKGTFNIPEEMESNYLTIAVKVEDHAGNVYTNEKKLTRVAIDKTAPVIEVTYDNKTLSNTKYVGNNQNRVATIDITELNFDPSAVKISLQQDGKAVTLYPNFKPIAGKVDKNGDQIGWRMLIDYAKIGEGEFDFDISYTDKAKNANNGWIGDDIATNKNFIIDNTKPTISVVMSNGAVRNGKYFASGRTATITIVERNFSDNYKFDWSGITLSLDGKALTTPAPKYIRSNDVTYERVYTVDLGAEGDYTFDVKYTDLADNAADGYACNSVAHKEFTVDTTAPVLDITGVADKSANNGEIAPIISYSDINFSKKDVSIVLTGVNNGVVYYRGNYADAPHGQTYTYANFETVQKVDDIYTLAATLTDMAGNTTSKSVTFSANRFGSVYDLSKVKDILGKYLQEEQDIIFTETNVDSLEREGIKIKLTKNGTPTDLTEGTDYTVTHTGGNGQWSVYTYTVNKDLFSGDGRYSLSVHSKDAAGNVNENINESKEAEISFGIDKTNPVIVPVDFESNKQYAVETKKVSVEIKDNLVLEGVKIYLNGAEVEYTVDGEMYTFNIPKSSSKQDVKIVAVDAAGNEQPIEINNFLVHTNIFVRWYNNTPLFVGSIIFVVLIALAATAYALFGKKKKAK